MGVLPRIKVIALGGTIAMTPGQGTGVVPSLSADDLLAVLPDIKSRADVHTKTLAKVASANISMNVLEDLLALILADKNSDGFVVTQGTDTLEETSFLFKLFYRGDRPIVFTGAMRNPSNPGADGPANLSDAITAASSLAPGVFVVMNGLVFDPVYVKKNHAWKVEAFSAEFGPVATVMENTARMHGSLAEFKQSFPVPARLPNIPIVKMGLEDSGILIDAISERTDSIGGLVVETYGSGHVNEVWRDKLVSLAKSIPVVFSSAAGQGRVSEATYGYKGAEIDLIENGLLPSGGLDSKKARLLLGVLIANQCQSIAKEFRSIALSA